jgi:LuxR family transcriptional regulator, quorum-sensing system regulator SdiA
VVWQDLAEQQRMIPLLEYIERTTDATSIEEVWSLHVRAMSAYGFDRLLYGFTRFRTAKSLGDRDDFLILSNHDPAYVEAFIDGGFYYHAPMVRWSAENVGSCSWSWMHENAHMLTEEERRVVAFNREHGITSGYSVSFRDSSIRDKGAIGLAGRPGMSQADVDHIWALHGREILQMNNVAHLKITSLPYAGYKRTLTARQRETLEWVGDGKTTQDIAMIMGLTAATVEKHLRLAREALDAETTAQAVVKASFQKQIFVFSV